MKRKLREHPEMIVKAGSTEPAEYWAWPPSSGFINSGSGPNPPRNPGACILSSVRLSNRSDSEELHVDLLCDGNRLGVMVPLYRKPEFQRYIASVLREHVGRTVDEISEVEIEWPQERD